MFCLLLFIRQDWIMVDHEIWLYCNRRSLLCPLQPDQRAWQRVQRLLCQARHRKYTDASSLYRECLRSAHYSVRLGFNSFGDDARLVDVIGRLRAYTTPHLTFARQSWYTFV